MSWSQNPQHDPQNSSGPSASDSSSIAANSNLQSLYYLLINNGKLQDLVNQQQMLDTDGISTLTQQLQQRPQEEETQKQVEQQQHSELPPLGRINEEQQQHQENQEAVEENELGSGSAQELRYKKTMSALEKAGLLDLTLKISELIKQNEALQKDIDTLEHIVETTYMVVMENQP